MTEPFIPDARNWISALEAGQEAGMTQRRNKATARAGSLMTSGNYSGAAAEIAPYDLRSGLAIRGIGAEEDTRRRRAAVGVKVAEGKGEDAVAEAYRSGDFELAGDLRGMLDKADDRQKALVRENASRVAEIVAPLGDIPETDLAARTAYIQEHRNDLKAAGYTDEQIDTFKPTNANLVPIYTQAMGLKAYLEQNEPKVVGSSLVRRDGKVLYEGTRYMAVPEGGKLVAVTGSNVGGGQSADPAPPGDRGPSNGPRGLRNNNPLNLEATVEWDGMTGSDGRYAVFSSPEQGWAAADRNIQTYATKHGLNTVAGIINRWAPPSENDSRAYAGTVAKRLGVDPAAPLNMADPTLRRNLLEAMAEVENGQRVAWGQGGGVKAQQGQPAPSRQGDPRGTIYGDPKPAEWTPDGKGLLINRNGDRKPDPAFAGTPEAGKVTEGERTAGFLASRLADSLSNLTDISGRTPGAAKPGIVEAAANAMTGGKGANIVLDADRQQVVANQLDVLDAALTLGTGAAYTREQLENYRDTYFPKFTDKPETVTAKRKKLLSLLEAAKIKAGRSAPPALDTAIKAARVQLGRAGSPATPTPGALKTDAGAISQAKAAIAKGAPRAAVIQRLRDNGINPAGL